MEADVDAVLALLNEASAWLIGRGIQQWPSPFPRTVVERDLKTHAVWLATIDGRPIATASTLTSDPMFWGDQPDSAWYLHRLARCRDVSGGGRQLLRWVELQATRSGVKYVRLDCGVG
jgi:hypothetical protein